jgi:hypothetical protein
MAFTLQCGWSEVEAVIPSRCDATGTKLKAKRPPGSNVNA